MEYKNKKPKIFILSGKARSGKDVCASIIEKLYENQKVIKVSYAYYLKEYIKKIGIWDGKEETKPRSFLQEFGVSFLKEKISSHFLLNRVIEDIKVYSYFYDVIIVTDARLKEEIEIPKKIFSNVITIRIQNEKENNLSKKEKEHITEVDLDTYKNFDYILTYTEDLQREIEKIKEGFKWERK